MPIINRFFGIMIFMFWREHQPPHFHAKYGDEEIVMEIKNGKYTGKMSKRAISLLQEWRKIHKKELMEDRVLAMDRKALRNIDPLE